MEKEKKIMTLPYLIPSSGIFFCPFSCYRFPKHGLKIITVKCIFCFSPFSKFHFEVGKRPRRNFSTLAFSPH